MIVLKDNLVKIGNNAILGSGYKRFHPHNSKMLTSMPLAKKMENMNLSGMGLVGAKHTTMKKKSINFLN